MAVMFPSSVDNVSIVLFSCLTFSSRFVHVARHALPSSSQPTVTR